MEFSIPYKLQSMVRVRDHLKIWTDLDQIPKPVCYSDPHSTYKSWNHILPKCFISNKLLSSSKIWNCTVK